MCFFSSVKIQNNLEDNFYLLHKNILSYKCLLVKHNLIMWQAWHLDNHHFNIGEEPRLYGKVRWHKDKVTSLENKAVQRESAFSHKIHLNGMLLDMPRPIGAFLMNLIGNLKLFGSDDGRQEIPNIVAKFKVFEAILFHHRRYITSNA